MKFERGRWGHSFSPDASALLAFDQGTGNMYSVNPATAAATLIGPGIPSTAPEDSTFTSDGQFFGTAFSGQIYRVDPHTGAATLLGTSDTSGGLLSLIYVVPEPGALSTLLMIFAFLHSRTRRQNRFS